MQRRPTLKVVLVHVSPVRDQQVSDVGALLRRFVIQSHHEVQRSVAVFVSSVDVGLSLNQRLDLVKVQLHDC